MAREDERANRGERSVASRRPFGVVVEAVTLRVRVSGFVLGGGGSCGLRNEGGGCTGGPTVAVRPTTEVRRRGGRVGLNDRLAKDRQQGLREGSDKEGRRWRVVDWWW
jgi:hypothetical protein